MSMGESVFKSEAMRPSVKRKERKVCMWSSNQSETKMIQADQWKAVVSVSLFSR